MSNLIFNFKNKKIRNLKNPKNILGGKGANLAEMGRLGLPVPPGFIISTKVCDLFYKNKKKLTNKLDFAAKSRWPLDPSAKYLKGPGLKL